MFELLSVVILSFVITSILIVPYINLLYKWKFQRRAQTTLDVFENPTPIFDRLHAWKKGTPVGGGLVVILVVSLLSVFSLLLLQSQENLITSLYPFWKETLLLFFTFISFGLLGLYDDLIKTFGFTRTMFWGLRMRHKLILQVVLAVFIAWLLYAGLGINLVNVPGFGPVVLGLWYIPLAAFIIIAFANAFNITDGLDGLAAGLLLICLVVLLILSNTVLDTVLSIFIGAWLGSLVAFLYFNVYPARIWMGDVGAMAFGATLGLLGLLLGKVIALAVVGGVFIVEVGSSLLQLLSKKFLGKKLFPVAPVHILFQNMGWEEPKVVARFWLAGCMFAILGLWLTLLKG
ncbi:hypothetical protein HY388_01905 [Candidatus Daviesbacteria bacterium]|nr:hypothetical protein [Candidatus Daviesbacteria bacterium]